MLTLTMTKPKLKDFLPCTSERCRSHTTLHKFIGTKAGLVGEGWYECQVCGTCRQDVRYRGSLPRPDNSSESGKFAPLD